MEKERERENVPMWETGLFEDVFICGMGRVENDIAGNMEPNKKTNGIQ